MKYKTASQRDGLLSLQGLTSNCFFVYSDKVLKTPAQHILKGYARHRVIQAAKACGYRVEQGPVSLDEADAWNEVFCTSAVSLLRPVHSIIEEPQQEHDHANIVWQADASLGYSVAASLFNQILEEEHLLS